jgi:hypothetical protein
MMPIVQSSPLTRLASLHLKAFGLFKALITSS